MEETTQVEELPDSELPMVSDAREVLCDLFTEVNTPLWYLSYPPVSDCDSNPMNYAPSDKKFILAEINEDLKKTTLPVLKALKAGIDELFSGRTLHNRSFWTKYLRTLIFELSAGLVDQTHRVRSEAELRHELLTPLLLWASHFAHATTAPTAFEGEGFFETTFEFEPITEGRQQRRGRKPQVDYALVGHVGGDSLYEVPAEVKKKLTLKDISQLAHYMVSLANGFHTKSNVSVGILLEEDQVRIAFNPLCFPDDQQTPVPMVFVSPAFKWRCGVSLNKGVCVALCLIQKLDVMRLTMDMSGWKKALGDSIINHLERVGKYVVQTGFVMKHSPHSAPYDVLEELQLLKQDVSSLTNEVYILRQRFDVSQSTQSLRPHLRRVARQVAFPDTATPLPPAKRPAMDE